MNKSVAKCGLLLGLVLVLVMATGFQAQAQFSKLYQFTNATGANQSSVRAIMHGFEVRVFDYADPGDWAPAGWGYLLFGGYFSTGATFGGGAVAPGDVVTVGWRTSDYNCYMRDLRWGSGAAVIPAYLGVGLPGGAEVTWEPSDVYPPGIATLTITNETDETIYLEGTDFGVVAGELSLDELADLDPVALRVEAIDALIDAMLALIDEAVAAGDIGPPKARSLETKLESAEQNKLDGLDAWNAGNEKRALLLWGKAAQQVGNVISELERSEAKGDVRQDLLDKLLPLAVEIVAALEALPDGVGSPVEGESLEPGESITITVNGVSEGAALVLCGTVFDGDTPVLYWVEQGVAEEWVPDTEPPVIISAISTPDELWPPDHEMILMTLDVTVADNSGWAFWYIESVSSNQPEDGLGDGDASPDVIFDPEDDLQALSLRRERSGNHPTETRIYTVTLKAIDMAGNESDPYELLVPVDHDQGD